MTEHSEISMPVPVALSCPGESVVADAAGIGMETSQSDEYAPTIPTPRYHQQRLLE